MDHSLVPSAIETLVTILGLGGVTIVSFTRLKTQVKLFHEHNEEAHRVINKKLDKLNGDTDEHGKEIVAIKTRCDERHGKKDDS